MILCLATARVGCHKYSTSNRTSGYQIHLSRVIDYYEENIKTGGPLACELRRIDWEEAMFEWRIIQPVIYESFYHKTITGTYIKRFKQKDPCKKALLPILEYPWYDSRELLKASNQPGIFYPGTYLRKMLKRLFIITSLCMVFFGFSLFKIAVDWCPQVQTGLTNSAIITDTESISDYQQVDSDSPVAGSTWKRTAFQVFMVLFSITVTFCVVFSGLNCWARCGILESGLLSIQTCAFVWRIVCITLLLAKYEVIETNDKVSPKGSMVQIYRGYTQKLGEIACEDLVKELHRIHAWLGEKEEILSEQLKSRYRGVLSGSHKKSSASKKKK